MELKVVSSETDFKGSIGLIVPLWNWKVDGGKIGLKMSEGLIVLYGIESLSTPVICSRFPGLIVPLWNWKCGCCAECIDIKRLNCTFMELKVLIIFSRHERSPRLNCTFMELKVVKYSTSRLRLGGLIVPLWNWKMRVERDAGLGAIRLNCTFMELKVTT